MRGCTCHRRCLFAYLIFDVCDLVLVQADSAALNHLAALALGREDLCLDCKKFNDVAWEVFFLDIEGRDT